MNEYIKTILNGIKSRIASIEKRIDNAPTVEIPKPLTYDYMPDGYPKVEVSSEEVVLLPETAIESYYMGAGTWGCTPLYFEVLPEIGNKYCFTIDGIDYEVEVVLTNSAGINLNISNTPLGGVLIINPQNGAAHLDNLGSYFSYTIKVTMPAGTETVEKIDPKFLPSTLPTVTASDAGKFLRVSNSGEWIVDGVSNATGASF